MTNLTELAKRLRENADGFFKDLPGMEQFRADLLAAAEIVERVEWRPIAEAPKDGTLVLGCYGDTWSEEYQQWRAPRTVSWRAYHPNAPGKKTWRDGNGNPVVVTYWRPLPAPPEVKP